MNKITGTLILCLGWNLAVAQVTGLRYSGQLLDEHSGSPVAGATVLLGNEIQQYTAVTDAKGRFIFQRLPAGYYQLTFQSLGYQSKSIVEIEINTGVPRFQVFHLVPSQESLEEVVVKAESRSRSQEAVTSLYTLTVEEVIRFPGTFYDPARLATHYAGVINENDQANNLVIRGNTPNGLAWYLEGIEIVNPNHLSNGGTLSDRSSQSGGGVNILSAQMMDNSTFLTGAFPAQYGNATSGIFDIRLREGAHDQMHFTAQAGLIGLDAAIEGPMGTSRDDSYLINYRYSTLGLLSTLGVDLGDEAIQFQDLSYHLKWNLQQKGTLAFFGMGGISRNVFRAPDFQLRDDFKDHQNIDFNSRMAATGVRFENTRWAHVLAYSGYLHERTSELVNDFLQFVPFEEDVTGEQRLGLHSQRRLRITHGTARIGVRANAVNYRATTSRFVPGEAYDNDKKGYFAEAYGEVRKTWKKYFLVNAGLHLTHFSLNRSTVVEPRIGLTYAASSKSNWSLAYGLHSRILPPQVLLISNRPGRDNTGLELMRSHHWVASNTFQTGKLSKLITEVFFQYLFDIPVAAGNTRSLSPINAIDFNLTENLVSDGTGTNAGIEMTWQQYFSGSTFFLLNGTLYDSKYTGSDGVRRNTRYNGRFGFNLTGGKEFSWQGQRKVRMLGVNLRGTWFGGFREGPIDIVQSVFQYRTVYDESRAFTGQLPDFFKVDLRFYYKWVKQKYTSIVGLDILNATNRENEAHHYYDLKKNDIVTRYHLGIIPNLSYRIEF